jgi:hypothetical protein
MKPPKNWQCRTCGKLLTLDEVNRMVLARGVCSACGGRTYDLADHLRWVRQAKGAPR